MDEKFILQNLLVTERNFRATENILKRHANVINNNTRTLKRLTIFGTFGFALMMYKNAMLQAQIDTLKSQVILSKEPCPDCKNEEFEDEDL